MASVKINDDKIKALKQLGKARGLELNEVADLVMGVGITRQGALDRYAANKAAGSVGKKSKKKSASKKATKKEAATKIKKSASKKVPKAETKATKKKSTKVKIKKKA